MEKDLTPFSHRWTIANLDWLCENVQGHQKLETKIQYNNVSTLNEPNKWITLELFPNGFDQESSNYVSLRIWADEYIFFRLWVENKFYENVLKVENSNKLSKEIKIKSYYSKTELLKNFNLQNELQFSISIEGVIVKTKSFNVLKHLNQINEIIEKTTVTYDWFDFMQSIHSISIYKWTIKNIQTRIKNGEKKFNDSLQFAKNISFKVILEEKDNLTWKLNMQLINTNSSQLFMWFRMKKIDVDENENSTLVKNEQQVKIFKEVNEILKFKSINMKKLQANKRKYFSDESLELSFEIIRFKNSIYQSNQMPESKLEKFVMERFVIFNYISFDSLKYFLENNLKKVVTRDELVNNFLVDQEKQEKVFETVIDMTKHVIEKMNETTVKEGSTFHINLQNVFLASNSNSNFGNIAISGSENVSEKTMNQFEKTFVEPLIKLQNEVSSLSNSIEKAYAFKSNSCNVEKEGVQITVEVEDLKEMLKFFIKYLLPFFTDEKVVEKLNNEWWNIDIDDKESMTLIGNIAKAKQSFSNTDFKNELTTKIPESISSFSVPINNSDIVYYWAMMFAYGDLNQMRISVPFQHLKKISLHVQALIEHYKKPNVILKNFHNNLTVQVSKLIIKQIDELTADAKEEKQLTRFITKEYLNEKFK